MDATTNTWRIHCRWLVELDGIVVAGLADPQFVDMFWCSWRVVPWPNDRVDSNAVLSGPFWDVFPRLTFRSNTTEAVVRALPAASHSHESALPRGRVTIRGLPVE